MHQGIPGATHPLPSATTSVARGNRDANGVDLAKMIRMVKENGVMVVGRRGCCMCYVVQRLLQSLRVNYEVYDVDEEHEAVVVGELSRCCGDGDGRVELPAMFVGGKLFGGLEKVIASHISGELVPILKDVGGLWL